MNLSYENLKYAADQGNSLGSWKGRPIYAISKMELAEAGRQSGPFIIYDENNRVYMDGNIIGIVAANGYVHEINPVPWAPPAIKKPVGKSSIDSFKQTVQKKIPQEKNYKTDGPIDFDDKILKDINSAVDELLKRCCEW